MQFTLTKTIRAKARSLEVPVIGIYKTPDATSWLVQMLFAAVQRNTSRARMVEMPAAASVSPGGFYATPVQSIEPELCKGRVVLTQWETDRLPARVVAYLNTARAVMTISTWCKSVFQRSGVRVPIHTFPLGVDTTRYCPDQAIFPPVFTFLTAGRQRTDGRKGIENVIAAFILAFANDSRAVLRVKLGPNDPAPELSSGRLQFIREQLTAEQLVHLYRTSSCYFNGSYAEGWGLHLHEALACGCPVVSPFWGGVTDFLSRDPQNFFEIPYKLQPASAHFGVGRWAQPDIPAMAQAMLTIADNGRRFLCLGEAGVETVSHLTVANMLDKMTDITARYV